MQPPQTTASKHLSGVPPLQTRSFAVPLEDLSDRLILCLSGEKKKDDRDVK